MVKPDITTRKDIHSLVVVFYTVVREDATLGPIFNRVITDWEHHFEIITDFWETSLLAKKSYKGDPFIAHQNVDKTMNSSLTMEHFGIWLNLWIETIDSLYKGEIAEMAKRRARKMATFLFIKIVEARK